MKYEELDVIEQEKAYQDWVSSCGEFDATEFIENLADNEELMNKKPSWLEMNFTKSRWGVNPSEFYVRGVILDREGLIEEFAKQDSKNARIIKRFYNADMIKKFNFEEKEHVGYCILFYGHHVWSDWFYAITEKAAQRIKDYMEFCIMEFETEVQKIIRVEYEALYSRDTFLEWVEEAKPEYNKDGKLVKMFGANFFEITKEAE